MIAGSNALLRFALYDTSSRNPARLGYKAIVSDFDEHIMQCAFESNHIFYLIKPVSRCFSTIVNIPAGFSSKTESSVNFMTSIFK